MIYFMSYGYNILSQYNFNIILKFSSIYLSVLILLPNVVYTSVCLCIIWIRYDGNSQFLNFIVIEAIL